MTEAAGRGEAGRERRVTRVAFQARDQSRVNVHVDGRFAFAISATQAVERGLKPGRLLTEADLAELAHLEEIERARAAALALLAVRPRSRREMSERLTRKEIAPEVVARVIDELAARGYIDDAAFARYWVENRQANQPRGAQALVAELRGKGVAPEVIGAAVAAAGGDEEASALALARRRARTLREPDARRFQQRLGAFLQRKGYRYETVRAVTRTVLAERAAAGEAAMPDEADPA